MRTLILLAVLMAALLTAPAAEAQNVSGMNSTKARYQSNRILYYDTGSGIETISAFMPVYFYDDFCGYTLQKYTASEDTHSLWKTVETDLNTAIGLVADAHQVSIALDTDDNASRGLLYFGDQECFDGYTGVTFEARVRNSVLCTDAAEVLIGLAGADNATADSVDVNAWFRIVAADSDALLWESDDNATNDDDNDAGTVIATATWYVLRIELSVDGNAKFFVDGSLVGTGEMGGLTTATGMVQPYIAVQKASGTGVGTLLVDYVRVWGNRK